MLFVSEHWKFTHNFLLLTRLFPYRVALYVPIFFFCAQARQEKRISTAIANRRTRPKTLSLPSHKPRRKVFLIVFHLYPLTCVYRPIPVTHTRWPVWKSAHIFQAHFALFSMEGNFLWRKISLKNSQQPNRPLERAIFQIALPTLLKILNSFTVHK